MQGFTHLNVVVRSLVWLAAVVWWIYLRKPSGSSLLAVRPGLSFVGGLVLTVLGSVVYVWAATTLASAVSSVVGPPSELLMRGPYRYVRNPLYLAAAAVFAGTSTLYAPWRARDLFTCAMVAVLCHVFVTQREEPRTLKRLGSAYEDYRAKVPRWIPRVRRAP